MKKIVRLTALLLAVSITCCNKNSNSTTAQNSTLTGKWTLVETLADPGDGSGKWTPVSGPDHYFLQFNTDNSILGNTYTSSGDLKQYKVLNDSSVNFIYANGNTVSLFYKITGASLTLRGGCIEACGSRFIR